MFVPKRVLFVGVSPFLSNLVVEGGILNEKEHLFLFVPSHPFHMEFDRGPVPLEGI